MPNSKSTDSKAIREAKKTAKKAKKKRRIDDPVLRELDSIKRLLILGLMKNGTPQSEIAIALEIDQGDLSRMLPARKFKSFVK